MNNGRTRLRAMGAGIRRTGAVRTGLALAALACAGVAAAQSSGDGGASIVPRSDGNTLTARDLNDPFLAMQTVCARAPTPTHARDGIARSSILENAGWSNAQPARRCNCATLC